MNRISKAVARFLMVAAVMSFALYGTQTVEAKSTEHSTHNTPLLDSGTTWYVATNGEDSPTCSNPASPCQTLGKAIDNATDGDTILVAAGTYLPTIVTTIAKDLNILGGWNSDFSLQTGFSTFDGAGSNFTLLSVEKNAVLERLILKNANQAVAISNWDDCLNSASAVLRQVSISGMKNTAVIVCGGTLTAINSTFYDNRGVYGAILNGAGTLIIQNSTITGNSSTLQGNAGGINSYVDVRGSTTVQNSIITGNLGGWETSQDCYGTTSSLGMNIIETIKACNINPLPSDMIGVNPKLGVASSSGYFPIPSDSPAVDKIIPTACPSVDQRGISRPQGSACDIGAYEYAVPGPATSFEMAYGSNQKVGPSLTFSLPLAIYVMDAFGTPVSNVDVTFTAPASGPSGIFAISGTNTLTTSTDNPGEVSANISANAQLGSYNVIATVAGLPGAVTFNLTNGGWFVSPNGNDANSCSTPDQSCLTINAAINKADSGGTIQVTGGNYTATSTLISQVVLIEKSITLSGGWNSDFSLQNQTSIIDGQGARRGVTIYQGTVVIDNFIIQNGGGGASGAGIQNLGKLTVSNSIIRNNTSGLTYSSGFNGGGIENRGGTLTVINSIMTGNHSSGSGEGSAIYASSNSITISNSSITNNTGAAAIYVWGTLNMTNSTVGGNSEGGVKIAYGTVFIDHSTITGNSGPGGVFGNAPLVGYDGIIKMQNSILAGNKNTLYGGDCYGIITSGGYNIIGNNTSCTISPGTGDTIGTAASPVDPMISKIAMKPHEQYMLFAGSPAIDAANPATCPATDQREIARPIGANCDIGSFEYGATPGEVAYFDIYSGSDQKSYQGKAFASRLAVYTVDSWGTPVTGVNVTFTAPSSDASGIFSDTMSNTATVPTSINGVAVTPLFRANYVVGDFVVNAEITEIPIPVNFSLKNLQVVPNYLLNGSLDDPILGNHWWQYSAHFGTPLCTLASCVSGGGTAGPRSGNTWARFGGLYGDEVESASISQNIIIPSGPAPTYLRFYLWIGQRGSAINELTVTIDGSNTPIFKAYATQHGQYYKYQPVVLDLSQYADDKLHSITFRGATASDFINFNVDDISLDVATFGDVPSDHWAWQHIDRLFNASVTGGCSTSPMMYCPETYVNRAQMAVFILRAEHGNTYTPPASTGTKFTDVPANYWAAAWIEQLAAEGITGGCGNGKYCPETTVTRDQMAIFLLRGMYGNTYTPSPASGSLFGDVAADHWAAAWIEELANEGITGGCGNGNYCPRTPVTRAQMAVFLVKAFGLP